MRSSPRASLGPRSVKAMSPTGQQGVRQTATAMCAVLGSVFGVLMGLFGVFNSVFSDGPIVERLVFIGVMLALYAVVGGVLGFWNPDKGGDGASAGSAGRRGRTAHARGGRSRWSGHVRPTAPRTLGVRALWRAPLSLCRAPACRSLPRGVGRGRMAVPQEEASNPVVAHKFASG
jgi:hypothetical protein